MSEKMARKKLNSGIKTLQRKIGIGNKYKAALKTLSEAAELFKMLDKDEGYAQSEENMSICLENLGEPLKAAMGFHSAGAHYLQSIQNSVGRRLGEVDLYEENFTTAFKCFEKSSTLYAQAGKTFLAGKGEKEVVEFIIEEIEKLKKTLEENESLLKELDMEKDKIEEIKLRNKKIKETIPKRVKLGIHHFDRAINFFEDKSNVGHLNLLLTMAGDFCAVNGKAKKARKYYEQLLDAEWNQENANTGVQSEIKFVAYKIATKICLSMLLELDDEDPEEGLVDLKNVMDDFCARIRDFKKSTEHILLHGICISFEQKDKKRFEKEVKRYSKSNTIKDFMLEMLLSIKQKLRTLIGEEDDDGDEDNNL